MGRARPCLQPSATIRTVLHRPVPPEYLEFAGANACLAVRRRLTACITAGAPEARVDGAPSGASSRRSPVRADRYRGDAVARREENVSVELDAEMVERARVQLGLDRASGAIVVERALNAYLLGRLLDATQASAALTEHDAERIAYEELHSSRRERGAA
jgi:hypothetical protein